MYKQVIVILAATLTYGCARRGTATPVMLPDQSVGSVLECNRKADCFRVASHACHGAYTVVESNDQPANDFMSVAPDRGMAEYVIRCTPREE